MCMYVHTHTLYIYTYIHIYSYIHIHYIYIYTHIPVVIRAAETMLAETMLADFILLLLLLLLMATETMLAETMLADFGTRAARVDWCKCTCCTAKKISYFLSGTFLVVQPVHLHEHTRAARVRKSANMVSILPR